MGLGGRGERCQSVLRSGLTRNFSWAVGLLLWVGLSAAPALAGPAHPFPEPRPQDRSEAATFLADPATERQLLNSKIAGMLDQPAAAGVDPAQKRALGLLLAAPVLPFERAWGATDHTVVRYTIAEGAPDRIPRVDLDHNGVPDRVQTVGQGLAQARDLLVDRMGFEAPVGLEVVLANLGGRYDGYLIPGESSGARMTAVIDSTARQGVETTRRAAIRQYAHAVTRSLGAGLGAGWAEALAQWAVLTIDGGPDDVTASLVSNRLEHLDAGLFAENSTLAAGNAIWLSFLSESYGFVAVRLTIEELARDSADAAALDRALQRATEDDLPAAFREFHLWSILTGRRADAYHFPFAAELSAPRFASANQGLPALSVQADPAVATWGAAQVLIRPEATDGGLRVRFEGDFAATWEADLVVVTRDGTLRRLSIELSDGRGEIAVPLDSVREALLLVRSLDSDDGLARHYTYAAHRERGYPFEIVSVDAVTNGVGPGVVISWETLSEQELIGFNVLRAREAGGQTVTVNNLWVPALGNENDATGYFFLDPTAKAGVAYRYRIQGITSQGMTSTSRPVSVRPSLHAR